MIKQTLRKNFLNAICYIFHISKKYFPHLLAKVLYHFLVYKMYNIHIFSRCSNPTTFISNFEHVGGVK